MAPTYTININNPKKSILNNKKIIDTFTKRDIKNNAECIGLLEKIISKLDNIIKK